MKETLCQNGDLKDLPKKTRQQRYSEKNNLVRSWISFELQEFLSSGLLAKNIIKSSEMLCKFLKSKEAFLTLMEWLEVHGDLEKE